MENKLLLKILDGVSDGVYFVDNSRKITFWNKKAEEITGFKAVEIVGKYCYDNLLNHVDLVEKHLCTDGCPLHSTIADGKEREQLVYLQHKDGYRIPVYIYTTAIYDNDDNIVGAVETFNDKSQGEDIVGNVCELSKLAYEDELTKLHNRRYIMNHLKASIQKYKFTQEKMSIAIIDIDFFKKVNDKFGHDVGNEVLKMIASELKSITRPNDKVGRYGGEEFLIVFDNIDEKHLYSVIERYRYAIENSKLREFDLAITVSIGETTITEFDTDEIIFKRCDEALYKAKNNGRNRVEIL